MHRPAAIAPATSEGANPPDTIADGPGAGEPWKNPAASAALTIGSQLLGMVEKGITDNYDQVDRARAFSSNLVSTNEILGDAAVALKTDANDMNDSFIPLIERASGSVETVAARLQAKELTDTWRSERQILLDTVKSALVISNTLAQQLDPTK